mgnify:CR=1 FL=1
MDKINNGLKSRELYELISLQPEIIEKLDECSVNPGKYFSISLR